MTKEKQTGMEKAREHEHLHEHQNPEQEQQEKLLRLSMLEQEAKQMEQQLMVIEQQIFELQNLKFALDEIDKAKEKDEILASLGRNIFVETALLSKELLVNVGARTVVKKSIAETKELVEKDIAKISELRNNLAREFEKLFAEMQNLA